MSFVLPPDRVGQIYLLLEEQLRSKTGISIHQGKTKLWNAAGCKPSIADTLTAAAQRRLPEAVVWRGDQDLPESKQGLKVLGVPVGHEEFVKAQLGMKSMEHLRLFQRIPAVEDVQAGWLLLSFCAATRSTYWLRTVRRSTLQSSPPNMTGMSGGVWRRSCKSETWKVQSFHHHYR